jgi:hypothetical protein
MSKLNFWKTILSMCAFCAVEAIASPAQTFNSLLTLAGPAANARAVVARPSAFL